MVTVIDAGDLRKYRTEIPNTVDDMGLSVYAFRLYAHLKRVAGDGGRCFQGRRKLAEHCGMSSGMITNAKRELVERGLIEIAPGDSKTSTSDTITIVDIWQENFKQFANRTPGHTVTTPSHHMTTPGHTVTHPGHVVDHKKEPVKKEPVKKEPITSCASAQPPKKAASAKKETHPNTQPVLQAYLDVLDYEPASYPQEATAAKAIAKAGYTPDDVAAAYSLLKAQDFWASKHLSLVNVHKQMPAMKQALLSGKSKPKKGVEGFFDLAERMGINL